MGRTNKQRTYRPSTSLARDETAYSGQSFQATFEEEIETCNEHHPEWERTSKDDIHENEHECEFHHDESELGAGRCVCPASLSSSACHLFVLSTSSLETKMNGCARLSIPFSE
jgi:hypothetical protein